MEIHDPLKTLGMHVGASSKIFKNANKLRNNLTEAEQLLWEYLRTKPNGVKWRRQHPQGTYILDFYCHSEKVSIELDGGYHNEATVKELDRIRTKSIQSLGIMELRFSNEAVLTEFDNVIAKITTLLKERS